MRRMIAESHLKASKRVWLKLPFINEFEIDANRRNEEQAQVRICYGMKGNAGQGDHVTKNEDFEKL